MTLVAVSSLPRAIVAAGAVAAAAWGWHSISEAKVERAFERRLQEGEAVRAASATFTGNIPRQIRESSGVAVSREHAGVLWSHNDSGNDPILYAIDIQGRLLASFEVGNASLRDWEDVSLSPCPVSLSVQKDCLYLGDIGDNQRRRSSYAIYIIPEPDPFLADSTRVGRIAEIRSVDFVYPDEPHDAEAMAVSSDGDVTIVTKGRNGLVQMFVLTRDAVARAIETGLQVTIESAGSLPIEPVFPLGRVVTGAAYSPSGVTLAVRTYTEIFLFTKHSDGSLTPPDAACFLGFIEPGGEAVDFIDEETMVLTSEWSGGQEGTIYRVRC